MKKNYQRPDVSVVSMKQSIRLLDGSNGFGSRASGYTKDTGGGFTQDP